MSINCIYIIKTNYNKNKFPIIISSYKKTKEYKKKYINLSINLLKKKSFSISKEPNIMFSCIKNDYFIFINHNLKTYNTMTLYNCLHIFKEQIQKCIYNDKKRFKEFFLKFINNIKSIREI